MKGQLLEAETNLLHLRQGILLSDAELAAASEGIQAANT